MASSQQFLKLLKTLLKERRITYNEISKRLGMSESSVKRMFSVGNFSLKRLDEIANIFDIEMSELVLIATERERRINELTLAQEQEIVDDPRLLILAYVTINYWGFDEIYRYFNFEKTELIAYLIRLEKMEMLSLGINNKITPTVSANFFWHPGGPIDQFFHKQIAPEFFGSTFLGSNDVRFAKNGEITEKSRTLLNKRVIALGEYFDELCFNDRNEEIHVSRTRTSLVLGFRKWDWSLFEEHRRITPLDEEEI